MTSDEAWQKITQITNKERMTEKDFKDVRALMKFMTEREQSWVEEGLFLRENARKRG
jgi:hypothetical protein